VNQGGRLERLAWALLGEARGDELPQLVVHEGQQVGRGPRVAGCGGVQELCDVGRGSKITAAGIASKEAVGLPNGG
jgi:hypothetical protein